MVDNIERKENQKFSIQPLPSGGCFLGYKSSNTSVMTQ